MVAVVDIGLQGLLRIAQVHPQVNYVVMDHNLFNKGEYEAFLGFCGGLVEVFQGELEGFVEVIGRVGRHIVGCFLCPQFG
ncbi:MAG: hypothetical protein NC924_07605 [Candidatus Omnitrophica bacterium]|nr:hypothetical protein [Candidatus Omnitrophota bacterium]